MGEAMHAKVSKSANLKTIDMISHLAAGWDGNGGLAFSPETIQTFKNVINSLAVQPRIAPTGKGSLFMQFQPDFYVELYGTVANVLWAGMVEPVPVSQVVEYINRILATPEKANVALAQ